MTTTLSDLRLGLRLVRHTPVTACAAVLSLALGIGANTAIFTVLHAVVLSPLPYTQSSELMVVWETNSENAERSVAPANFVDWRRELTAFASLAAFDEFRPTLTGNGEPEVLRALGASGTFFTTLGVTAAQGRTLAPQDDAPGADGIAVLSDGFWERSFARASDVIGRQLLLDGRPYTIAGIMPPEFESPLQTSAIDVWLNGDRGIPRTFPFGGDLASVRDSHLLYVIGRLKPGVSRAVAQQELTVLMAELSRRHPSTNAGLGGHVKALHEQVVGRVSGLVMLLQLAVGIMLLIACANVAHLLLGQAAKRQNEMTTRIALGAARGRLIRQLFAETLVIAVPGGVLGIVLAQWGVTALIAAGPQALPRLHEISIDTTVLGFTLVITLVTVLLFGVGPTFHLARQGRSLQTPSALRTTGARSLRRWHHAIVITELALAHVLLIGAGLLLASFMAAQRVPLGFATDGRVAADLTLAADRYLRPSATAAGRTDTQLKQQFVSQVLERLRTTSGTRAAAASFTSPLTGAPNRGVRIEGRPDEGPGFEDSADFQVVTPDFFRAVGATIVRGRDFSARDGANTPAVALINQAFADRYFAGQNPIGQRLLFGRNFGHEIVGVIADMRYRYLESPADPTFYLPITQNDERWPFLSFTVWSDRDAASTASILRAAIRETDPLQAVMRVRSYDEVVATALAARRFNTLLVVTFAAAALLLAAVGIYGVMSYAVSIRTRELGLRAAIGASPCDLFRLVFGEGLALTFGAVGAGLAAGWLTTGVMRAMLFEVAPHDPGTFAAVAVTLSVVALSATWLPARRAVRVDPVDALRDG
jgi:putative ABC transport system permease protein